MRWLRSAVGLTLCVLASVLVAASVVVDRWQLWRQRRRDAAERRATADRVERLRRRVREVRQLADEQAAAVERHRHEDR